MIAIINELLDLARIDDRRGKDFHFTNVDATALVRQVAADFRVPAGQPPIWVDVPAEPYTVRADTKKLIQAVLNILSNAYKYAPAGGPVSISLTHRAGSGVAGHSPANVGIRVTDHGIGMTQEQLARVCERFYRADASGNIPGTGLGMSIVQEIMDVHGGELEIQSQAGVGTVVTLWLAAANPEVS
jgi:signal transduction histidine kinase